MMRMNVIYLICGATVAVVAIFGYQYYEKHRQSNGVEINIDDNGVSIKKN
jgi:predicted negative regulator of RcsB-dependent stress response